MLLDLLNRLSCNSAVKCDKVNSVLSMKSYNIDEILSRKLSKISLIVDNAVIYGDRTYHCRA